jgi:hypothetical protein
LTAIGIASPEIQALEPICIRHLHEAAANDEPSPNALKNTGSFKARYCGLYG